MQMLPAHMMINASDPALENRKVILQGIHMGRASHVLLSRALHGVVIFKLSAEMPVRRDRRS